MHLAASISVPESMKKPEKYYNNNVVNLINLLNVCKETKIKHFIFSSTAAVYGNINKKTVSENDIKVPTNIYGKTKLYGEELVKHYSKTSQYNYIILRYFNVIGSDSFGRSGPIINQGHLLGNILDSIFKKNFKINVYGNKYKTHDGTGIRDYIDVEDISNIHIKAYNLIKKNKKSYELNCGNSKGHSVLQVIKNFEKYTKKNFLIKIKPPRSGDVGKIVCDNNFMKKKLGLNLKNKIIKSIENSINWRMKQN
tara:strand:- start:640 stop:1398 length:759 start_codon:yes stop_codon:yes gene_type:complete